MSRRTTNTIVFLFILFALPPFIYIHKLSKYKNVYKERKVSQYLKKFSVDLPFKNIYDRNGAILAASIPKYSYFVDTTVLKSEEEVQKVASIFHYDVAKLLRKYRLKRKFVWLKRKTAKRIEHGFKGIFEVTEFSRFYPYGKIISHIVGVRNKENQPLGGLELSLNNKLYMGKQTIRFIRGADGEGFLLTDFIMPSAPKDGITTTLDIKLQNTLYEISKESFDRWKPQNLIAIAIDPNNGDILAWVQIPTFDPARYNVQPIKLFNNLALTSPLEPGSLFKPFFYYTLLKKNIVDEDTKVYCENGHYRIRARHIFDHTPHGTLSAKEVIAYSSNIGITKLSQKLRQEDFLETLKTFNLLNRFSIGFVNTLKTKITPFEKWSYHTLISLPMGYEILTSPFHLIRAYSMFANGGYLVNLSILRNREMIRRRVLDEKVVEKVRNALGLVTKIGTAKRADSKLYTVEGKTGTSKLLGEDNRYTANKHRSFFIGFAPHSDTRLLVYFQLDNPQGAYFGGTVAAPYVKEFIEKSLQKLFVKFELNATKKPATETARK